MVWRQSLQPQEPGDGLLELGSAGCHARTRSTRPVKTSFMIRPARISGPRIATPIQDRLLTGHRIGLQVEHRTKQVEILGLAGSGVTFLSLAVRRSVSSNSAALRNTSR